LAILLLLNTNCIVLEGESDLAQSTNKFKFIGKVLRTDGAIICVKSGHNTSMVGGLRPLARVQ
jgi:hypothetical protein